MYDKDETIAESGSIKIVDTDLSLPSPNKANYNCGNSSSGSNSNNTEIPATKQLNAGTGTGASTCTTTTTTTTIINQISVPLSDSNWRREQNNEVEETIDLNAFINTVPGASLGLFFVVLDWLSDITAVSVHFVSGNYYFSAATLFIVFGGGFIVTINLNFLIYRQGDKKFKDELRKICRILPYAMYLPSFLPFFSCGLRVYVAQKLRRETNGEEIERLKGLMKICIQHVTTDLLYERCYEAFPQAVLQTVILMEKPLYKSYLDFLPLVCVLLAWVGLSLSPFQISNCVNKIKLNPRLFIAGLSNKGVTLLSFVLLISSSRSYFCGLEKTWNLNLILATILPFIILTFLSDLPGMILFESERRLQSHSTIKHKLQLGLNMAASLLPIISLVTWIFTLYLGAPYIPRYIFVLCIFLLGWVISLGELCDNVNVTWLGQFSTDIIILSYIGFLSYFKGIEFHNINFQYVSPHVVQEMRNL